MVAVLFVAMMLRDLLRRRAEQAKPAQSASSQKKAASGDPTRVPAPKKAAASQPQSNEHAQAVRELAKEGRYLEAARLQIAQKNLREALNLLEYGDHFAEAAKVAEELGMVVRAVELARRGEDFQLAARLLKQQGNITEAVDALRRAEDFEQAAKLLETDPHHDPERLVNLWASASLQQMPGKGAASPRALEKAQSLAERALDVCQRNGLTHKLATTEGMLRSKGVFGDVEPISRPITRRPAKSVVPGAVSVLNLATGAATRRVNNAAEATQASAGNDASDIIYIQDGVTGQSTAIHRQHDRYEIEDLLGQGGMGVVYRATDRVLGRKVALKFLPSEMAADPEAHARFEREARAAASVSHPSIVTIHDFGIMGDRPFICMEYIEGQTFYEMMAEAAAESRFLPLSEILEVSLGLMTGLQALHKRGVLHRDIKPGNVMRSEDGLVKLMDFGIAGRVGGWGQGEILGTPEYMAPEQFEGQGLAPCTDVFSAGVTIYKLLTFQNPYDGSQNWELPARPSRHRDDVPLRLDHLVMSCLHPKKANRPQSTTEAIGIIRQLMGLSSPSIEPNDAGSSGVLLWSNMKSSQMKISHTPHPAPNTSSPTRAAQESTKDPWLLLPHEQATRAYQDSLAPEASTVDYGARRFSPSQSFDESVDESIGNSSAVPSSIPPVSAAPLGSISQLGERPKTFTRGKGSGIRRFGSLKKEPNTNELPPDSVDVGANRQYEEVIPSGSIESLFRDIE